jgi:hypothetical protein
MLCPGCGRDNPLGSAFCGFCGHPIAQSSAAITDVRQGPTSVPVQRPWAPEAAANPSAVIEDGRPAHRSDHAATRYLCAAVALSPTVRQRALENVLEEEHRAVVTTPGVDLVTVLKYALAAHRRQVIRDVVLLVLLCALIVSFFLRGPAVVLLLLLAATWLTVCVERYANSGGAARALRPDTFSPDKVPSPARNSYAGRQLKRIAAADTTGNVSIYSKFPPFVGYGPVSTSWSFAVDVTRPQRTTRPKPFSVHEVYDCVKAGLGELDLPGMEVMDRVFVNGRDIRDDRSFLPDPHAAPVTSIGADLMRTLMATPEERARPYLTIGMTSWQGDLVVTMFIRFLLSRSDLFVEAAHTVVPPLRADFKAIDEQHPDMQPREFLALVGGSLISTIPRLLGSVPGIFHELGADGRRERKRRRVEETGDYGALVSVREEAADNKWQRYFQVLDDARYVKVIQQRIFRSLVAFLEEHDIDTSSLVARSETLVNNGVMVTAGGTVNAGAVAAGANAQAVASGLGAQAARLASRVSGGEGGGGHDS